MNHGVLFGEQGSWKNEKTNKQWMTVKLNELQALNKDRLTKICFCTIAVYNRVGWKPPHLLLPTGNHGMLLLMRNTSWKHYKTHATEVEICWGNTIFLLRTAVGLWQDDKHPGIADRAYAVSPPPATERRALVPDYPDKTSDLRSPPPQWNPHPHEQ